MEVNNVIYWDHQYSLILLINLAIAIVLFTSIRFFSGIISHINASKELLKKDNPAFGISMAGAVIGVTIVLQGAIFGDPVFTLEDSVISVGLYGVLGIVLMALTRLIFDKIALPKVSIRDEIVKGNVAAGIIDAGNVIATAIVIYAAMTWVSANTVSGIFDVLIAYIISQCLLTAATRLRVKQFSIQNDGKSIQDCFHAGNMGLALDFAGRRIGSAFAITAASHILVYEVYDAQTLLAIWAVISIAVMIILTILDFIATRIILFGIDVRSELVEQKNPALGVVQGAIFVALAMLLSSLMS